VNGSVVGSALELLLGAVFLAGLMLLVVKRRRGRHHDTGERPP